MEIWSDEFKGAVTVCDREGVIIYINQYANKQFLKNGGKDLLGTNLLDCHPEPSRTLVQELLKSARSNVYTIEKGGIKKLIYQSPWFEDGTYAGLVELSLPIPKEMPHFVRDKKE